MVFAFGLFGFACFFILPQFSQIFADFGMQLPVLTQIMFQFVRRPLELVAYPALMMLALAIAARFWVRRTESGRRRWARLVYAFPIAGTLIRSARLATFADLLAILVDHAIPLPEAFRLAGESCGEPLMASTARRIEAELSQGRPLGEVLRGRGLVPEWVAWMVGLGEQRGTLGETLHQIAATYRRQVEMRAALLRSVLPPFLIIITAGLFTAFFVIGVMLPVQKLLEGLAR
jgi:type II secretory pathway component PulF